MCAWLISYLKEGMGFFSSRGKAPDELFDEFYKLFHVVQKIRGTSHIGSCKYVVVSLLSGPKRGSKNLCLF